MTTTTHPNSLSPVVCRPGEGEHVLQMRACVTVKLPAGATPDRRVSAAEFLMPPGFGPPLHIHHQEDEILQILEGSVRVVCGDTDIVLDAGGFAYLPRDVPHTFRVQDDGRARMIAFFTPGGFEAMFVESGIPSAGERLPEEEATSPAAFDLARYGCEFVGPPLSGE
jgi:mannose-6-phosphate isomerase-like protein (cupin superfamily)